MHKLLSSIGKTDYMEIPKFLRKPLYSKDGNICEFFNNEGQDDDFV